MTERLITAEQTEQTAQPDTALRPLSLAEFVGQGQGRRNLETFIHAARVREDAMDHTLLHGPPGLGKTTMAQIIASELGVGFRATSGPVIARAGDLAALLTNLAPRDVLFIDEIHTVIGAGSTSGGSMDASNLLKPSLQGQQLRCIGSTTYKEYRQFFDKDRALSRRFQKIDVEEPNIPDTIKILMGLKSRFESFHGLKYSNESIKTAVELSSRYMSDRKLPDKAIDVIDETGASQKLKPISKRKKTINQKDIEQTISTMARIPSKQRNREDIEKLKDLEKSLKRFNFGQEKGIEEVVSSIRLSRAG